MKLFYCSTCGAPKARGGGKRHRLLCKPCEARKNRAYRAAHKARLKQHKQDYRAKFPEKWRERNLVKNYGITLADYNAMLAAQEGVCAICRNPERANRYGCLAVDHDHSTGRIRGLLCSHCNRALGLVADRTSTLSRMISYLTTPAAPKAA